MAIDFWEKGPRYQKQMTYAVLTLWFVLMAGAAYPVLATSFRKAFGS
jgi:succinate dehydrogenase / fumarate reductase cytochrome b subunit